MNAMGSDLPRIIQYWHRSESAEHTKRVIFGLPYEMHTSVRGEGFGFMMRTETPGHAASSDTEKCEGAVTRNKAVH